MVTGLRAKVDVAPRGECELHLTCAVEGRIDGSSEFGLRCIIDDARMVLTRARGMVDAPEVRFNCAGWRICNVVGFLEAMRKQNRRPWRGGCQPSFVKLYRKLRCRACTAGLGVDHQPRVWTSLQSAGCALLCRLVQLCRKCSIIPHVCSAL